MYTFQGFTISARMMKPILRYVHEHRRPGDFLQAVIRNDLRDALFRADAENLANIKAFVGYFHNVAPGNCHGSKEKLEAWVKETEDEARTD